MASFILMAMTNAAEGRDQEYNRWFDEVHVPQVLNVPGMETAQRYELTAEQRMPAPLPYRYATVYWIESDDLAATLAALGAAIAAGTKTPASDPNRRALWVYAPRGPERR